MQLKDLIQAYGRPLHEVLRELSPGVRQQVEAQFKADADEADRRHPYRRPHGRSTESPAREADR